MSATNKNTKKVISTAPATPPKSYSLLPSAFGLLFRKFWFPATLLVLLVFFSYRKDLSIQLSYGGSPVASDGSPVLISYSGGQGANKVKDAAKLDFIQRFAKVAGAEQQKMGVPAPLVLAIGLLQMQAHGDQLSQKTNNYFALPCAAAWHGATTTTKSECYRRYATAWESFRDHSLFITSGNFASLKNLDTKSLKKWAESLEKNGYLADGKPQVASRLLELIKTYNLEKLP